MEKQCRKCGSKNISFYKKVLKGKKQTQFHYGVSCHACKVNYKVPRTKEIYEIVKDIPWTSSKQSKGKHHKGAQPKTFKSLFNGEYTLFKHGESYFD